MRGRFLDRKSRKQFRHPLPPALATAAQPIIPRHRRAHVAPPPPRLLAGGTWRGLLPPAGAVSAAAVIPGSRRIHQPAPCPALYRGGTRHGWINQETQPKPVARRHQRHPFPVPLPLVAGRVHQSAPLGLGQTAKPIIPGHRVVHTPAPVGWLGGASRRGRVPGQVIAFIRLHTRRTHNPQARPAPEPGQAWRPRAPVSPPITDLTSIPVERGHRKAASPSPQPPPGACRRGRVPAPTAPFLLREGRRLRGTRPLPYQGRVSRARVPLAAQVAKVLVRKHRLGRIFLPCPGLLEGRSRHGLLFHTGLSAQVVLFPCDVPPARPEVDDDCASRPEMSDSPAARPEGEETCPVRPPECANET